MPRANALSCGDFGKPALIFSQSGTIDLRMPEMDHAGSKQPVLASNTSVQQAHNDIGIFLAPAAIVGVESIDAIEVGAPDGEVA